MHLHRTFIYTFAVALAFFAANAAMAAWSGPCGASPTNCNSAGPVDLSGSGQIKLGGLTVAAGTGITNGLIVSTGNVGIGTASPSSKLTVNGSFLTSGGSFEFRDAGVVDSTAVRVFDNSSNLYLQGNDIYFRGKTGGINVTVKDGGNVGIGATNPLYKLQVGDSGVAGSDGKISIGKNGGGSRYAVLGYDSGFNFGIYDQGVNRQFSIVWNSPVDSMHINSTGVGIGTASPAQKLDVAGNAKLSGNLYIGDMSLIPQNNGWLYLGNSAGTPYGGNGLATNGLYASGQVYSNGQPVCQSNGTNCPAAANLSNYLQFNTWQNNHYSGTDGTEYATNFRDTNDGNFYLDPNSTSVVSGLQVREGLDVRNAGGAYSYITLHDDESPNGGVKYIHANSNVIGFLKSDGNWAGYFDNSGNLNVTGNIVGLGQNVCYQNGVNCPTISSKMGGTYWNGGTQSYTWCNNNDVMIAFNAAQWAALCRIIP